MTLTVAKCIGQTMREMGPLFVLSVVGQRIFERVKNGPNAALSEAAASRHHRDVLFDSRSPYIHWRFR